MFSQSISFFVLVYPLDKDINKQECPSTTCGSLDAYQREYAARESGPFFPLHHQHIIFIHWRFLVIFRIIIFQIKTFFMRGESVIFSQTKVSRRFRGLFSQGIHRFRIFKYCRRFCWTGRNLSLNSSDKNRRNRRYERDKALYSLIACENLILM